MRHQPINTEVKWGVASLFEEPTVAQKKAVMRDIHRLATNNNVFSKITTPPMSEWLLKNVTNATIEVVDRNMGGTGEVWLVIGVDKATVMHYIESI